MKIKLLFGFLLLAMTINMTSCTEDEAEGLEDNLIDDDVDGDDRDAFIGTWTVTETSKLLGSRSYSANIEKDANFPQRVNIYNFYNLGSSDSVIANVSTVQPNTITVPYQTLQGNYMGGTGELAGSKITYSYTVDDGNEVDTVVSVYIK